jgi:phosphopantetheine--protein transferase-like protein
VVVECEFDVERHRFLRDHVFFGRHLSVADPDLRGLPILPLAVMLELMAEAAQMLHPAGVIRAIRDVRTMRWVSFESPTRRVRAEALAQPDGVRVTAFAGDSEGMSTPIAEAVFEMDETGGEPPLSPPALAEPAVRASFDAKEIYGRCMYHGPAFQGILNMDSCADFAAKAAVREPDFAPFVPPGTRPILPLVLIDISGQISGFPLQALLTEQVWSIVFPNSLQRVEFLHRRDPEQVLRAVTSARVTDTQMHSDCEFVDPAGRVVLRVLGRVEEFWRLPGDLCPYWSAPTERHLSQDITSLFRDIPGADRCTVCTVGNVADRFLVNRLWSQVVAHMVLSQAERRAFAELKLVPVPAASWLLGRVAAKDAVRWQRSLAVGLADVEVWPDGSGKPAVRILGETTTPPLVSLAHKGFAAIAVAADPAACSGVGIDLEGMAPVAAAVIEDAFTPQERALIEGSAGTEPAEHWILAAWGAKEAVGKALGKGVLGGPRSLEVVAIDPGTGRLRVALRGLMAEAFPRWAQTDGVDAYRRINGDWMMVLCLLP